MPSFDKPILAPPRIPRRLLALSLCVVAVVAGVGAAQTHMEAAPMPAPFSAGEPGAGLPRGWEPVRLTERKRPTAYGLVRDGSNVVLHANAVGAASGLAQFTIFDIKSAPIVEWRWKVNSMIEGADNRVAAREDSPARLIFAFDGDKSQLPLLERAVFFITEKLSGRQLPYALLQYIWAADIPVGTLIEHPHTRRVRMLVVASGAAGVGSLAVVFAQSAQRLPQRVPRGAGPAHRRRRADGHRQHRRLDRGVVRRHPVRGGGALILSGTKALSRNWIATERARGRFRVSCPLFR